MRYISLILAWLSIVHSSCAANTLQIKGYFNDVSPNEQWILYKSLDYPETDEELGDYELDMGTLRALNVHTGEEVIVVDNVFMKDANLFFLNDSIVAVPDEGCIKLYDLHTKEFEKNPLLTFNQDYKVLQFSFNENRTKAAVLLLDRAMHIHDLERDKLMASVELQIVDLIDSKKYVFKNYDFTCKEGCGPDYIGDMLWHGDQLVYSLYGRLYYYKLGELERKFIPTSFIETYAIDQDELILAVVGNGGMYDLKRFSFADLSITELDFDGNRFVMSNSLDGTRFYTTQINGLKRAVLSEYPEKSGYMRVGKGKFKKQDKLILYKSKRLSIEQLYDKLTIVY